jgi:hypothetical protein
MLGIIAGSFYGADYTARPKPGFFMPAGDCVEHLLNIR